MSPPVFNAGFDGRVVAEFEVESFKFGQAPPVASDKVIASLKTQRAGHRFTIVFGHKHDGGVRESGRGLFEKRFGQIRGSVLFLDGSLIEIAHCRPVARFDR